MKHIKFIHLIIYTQTVNIIHSVISFVASDNLYKMNNEYKMDISGKS